MPLYAGVDGAKKEIEALYAGVDGVTKRLESLYASVDGVKKELLVVNYYWNKYTVAIYNEYEYLVRETVPDQGIYGEEWTEVYTDPNGYPFSDFGFEPTQNHTEYGHTPSHNPDDSISFTYVKTTTRQGAGVFQEVVVSEDKNAYPSNGIASDGYWYISIDGGGDEEPEVPSFELPIQEGTNLKITQIYKAEYNGSNLEVE